MNEVSLMNLSQEESEFITNLRYLKDSNSPFLPIIRRLLDINDFAKLLQGVKSYENLALLLELSLLKVATNQSKGHTVASLLKNLSLGTEKELPTNLADIITYYSQLQQEITSYLISAMESQDYPRLIASKSFLQSLNNILPLIMSSMVEITTPTKSLKTLDTVRNAYANSGTLKEYFTSIITSNGSEENGLKSDVSEPIAESNSMM